jgi:hypothetical protein
MQDKRRNMAALSRGYHKKRHQMQRSGSDPVSDFFEDGSVHREAKSCLKPSAGISFKFAQCRSMMRISPLNQDLIHAAMDASTSIV